MSEERKAIADAMRDNIIKTLAAIGDQQLPVKDPIATLGGMSAIASWADIIERGDYEKDNT